MFFIEPVRCQFAVVCHYQFFVTCFYNHRDSKWRLLRDLGYSADCGLMLYLFPVPLRIGG